jgi:23S rRNA (guanine2445-N2)-methyltransferase / 23S rRNA (guanine2069-N7)-methyltransferase
MSSSNPLKTIQFFASCAKGYEDLLRNELIQLGIEQTETSFSGVPFKGELKDAYKACLWSRLASRILMPLLSFEAKNEDELYHHVQQIDWAEHLSVEGTLAVNAQLINCTMNNSQYAALKVKDAIVDQFMQREDTRPSVDRELPDIRINLFINKDQAIISVDLSGEPLHKRGYRKSHVAAPMKENLAAAVLVRAGWPNDTRTLVDPMCGSATFLIEAAMMALNIAPGLRRKYFGFINWAGHDAESWGELKREAQQLRDIGFNEIRVEIKGYDESLEAVQAANYNIQQAGLEKYISVDQQTITSCQSAGTKQTGLVMVNPPYGERLGEIRELSYLYTDLGDCWKHHFAGWNCALFTGNIELAKQVGLRSHKNNAFYNGPIKCKLFQYKINKNTPDISSEKLLAREAESRQMIANRLKKNFKHISKWAKRNNIQCYRVYDADLPEFSAAIDIYKDWVHVQEYQAPASIDIRKARQRFKHIIDVVPEILGIAKSHMVIKQRQKQKGQQQYERQANKGYDFIVAENNLKFNTNLHDYIDTGLFLDHRDLRLKVRQLAEGKDVLNLFAYTGSVSVYAAAGGAKSVTTIDMSNTYLEWAKQNFKLNEFTADNYHFIKSDCIKWLKEQNLTSKTYDLIFLDPPTFSNSKSMQSMFDIQKDHVYLIKQCMKLLNLGGLLIFSNNFRKFKLDTEALADYEIENITQSTMPEDFKRNQKIHHCWLIQ